MIFVMIGQLHLFINAQQFALTSALYAKFIWLDELNNSGYTKCNKPPV